MDILLKQSVLVQRELQKSSQDLSNFFIVKEETLVVRDFVNQ